MAGYRTKPFLKGLWGCYWDGRGGRGGQLATPGLLLGSTRHERIQIGFMKKKIWWANTIGNWWAQKVKHFLHCGTFWSLYYANERLNLQEWVTVGSVVQNYLTPSLQGNLWIKNSLKHILRIVLGIKCIKIQSYEFWIERRSGMEWTPSPRKEILGQFL